MTLVEGVPNGSWAFGAWSNDGRIVFDSGRELSEVSAEGGAASPASVSSPWDESSVRFPALVDATGDVLFVSGSQYTVDPRIEAIDRETGERLAVRDDALLVGVTHSGHLLFVRDEVLMAATYDAATHRVGPAVPLPKSIARDNAIYPQLAI